MNLKKAILRGLSGFLIGVFIWTTIGLIISFMAGKDSGEYYESVSPMLIESMESELNAVVLQYFMSGILGSIFAFASAIFEVEEWSIIKQTTLHFLMTTISMFTIGYACFWFDHHIYALLVYFLTFVAAYIIIFIIQYRFWKNKVDQVNKKLQAK